MKRFKTKEEKAAGRGVALMFHMEDNFSISLDTKEKQQAFYDKERDSFSRLISGSHYTNDDFILYMAYHGYKLYEFCIANNHGNDWDSYFTDGKTLLPVDYLTESRVKKSHDRIDKMLDTRKTVC